MVNGLRFAHNAELRKVSNDFRRVLRHPIGAESSIENRLRRGQWRVVVKSTL